ncbi:prepilin peptidase [Marinobacter sediminum]|uniref:A24 family peptidase n=1 Tax=Marinobacter sediminum TaxID=256323 RepID=UPI00202DE4CD|nr:A24 family peptidase [Marinobacter sediminum]MCM0612000.1 prepilin peptidase [Marinobacter sediminum]
MTQPMITVTALLLLLVPAVVSDLRYRRIPNLLVFPAWALALVLGVVVNGVTGGLDALTGMGSALLVGLPFWLVGWIGGGDVKLVAAIGALVGPELVWPILAAIGISGLFLALGALLHEGILGSAVRRYWASLSLSMVSRRGVYVRPDEAEQDVRLPYALAIAVGTIATYGWIAF